MVIWIWIKVQEKDWCDACKNTKAIADHGYCTCQCHPDQTYFE